MTTDPIAVLADSLTASTLAAILADLDLDESRRPELSALAHAFADQLASLEGDEAAERLRPEFHDTPAGRSKVQWL